MTESTTDEETEDEYGTTSPNYRWKGLATVMALGLGLGFPITVALHSIGMVDLTTIPQWAWLPIITGWSGVMIYTFGEDIKGLFDAEP